MSLLSSSIVVGFALATTATTIAQNKTVAEALQQRHVALTKAALLTALRSPEAEVRGLAAAKLAEDKTEDAIPAIAQALAAERVSGTKVNIAFALAQLGNESGRIALKRACHDTKIQPEFRVRAAQYMLDLNSNACLPDVLDLLDPQNVDDTGYRMGALWLVPQFKNVSDDESQKLLAATLQNLEDTTPAVRMSASDALAWLGDSSAIPYLHNAIAAEQDEVVRHRLEDALQRLQRHK